jgi:hypothetical protein
MFRRFSVPENIHNPITLAIIQQLKAVNTPGERFRIIGVVAGFVGAPDLNNVAELFGLVVNGVLKETARSHSSAAARNVVIDRKDDGIHVSGLAILRSDSNRRD